MPYLPKQIELFAAPVEGILERPVANHQPGRVKAMGTTWNARFHKFEHAIAIAAGDRVLIVGRQGITLLIAPMQTRPV